MQGNLEGDEDRMACGTHQQRFRNEAAHHHTGETDTKGKEEVEEDEEDEEKAEENEEDGEKDEE